MNSRHVTFRRALDFESRPRKVNYSQVARQGGAEAARRLRQYFANLTWLDFMISQIANTPIEQMNPAVRCVLRIATADILLNKTEGHAAVYEHVELIKSRAKEHLVGFVNAVLRNMLRKKDQLKQPTDLHIRFSHPAWLVDDWSHRFGQDKAESICRANNSETNYLVLRTNTLQTTRDQLLAKLRGWCVSIEPCKISPVGILCRQPQALSDEPANKLFNSGHFYVQNEATQLAAFMLRPNPGATVLDLCAAPGGKATHLAELVGPSGRVIAVDSSLARLASLESNVECLQIRNVQIKHSRVEDLSADIIASARFVLLDAPCSGLGVLRKAPEGRWLRTPSDLQRQAEVQRDMIQYVAAHMTAGSRLLFGVCTISSQENEQQISWIQDQVPSLRAIDLSTITSIPIAAGYFNQGNLRILPVATDNLEGYFAALFEKI